MFEGAGIFGTRADLIVDLVLISMWILPFLFIFSFRLAKKKAYETHRNIQIASLILVTIMVVLFEINIRFYALTESIDKDLYYGFEVFNVNILLITHIFIAVATFLCWVYLVIKSLKSFPNKLPGSYSMTHKQLGILIFLGICFTTLSGTFIYKLLFV